MECCSSTINGLRHWLCMGGRMQRCLCSGWNIHEHNKNIQGLWVRILDRHHSHTTLEAINGARAHDITLLTLSPHISHKMWPLDIIYFKAPLPYYKRIPIQINSESDTILTSSPYKNQEKKKEERRKEKWELKKKSIQLRNKNIKKPKSTIILPIHNDITLFVMHIFWVHTWSILAPMPKLSVCTWPMLLCSLIMHLSKY